jgi:hypothetical protein
MVREIRGGKLLIVYEKQPSVLGLVLEHCADAVFLIEVLDEREGGPCLKR